MRTFCSPVFAGALLAVVACVCTSAQAPAPVAIPAPRITITNPSNGAYVSGPTTLQAMVEPADGVGAVVFFVDGRQQCVVPAPPFDCEWDAGRSVSEHQIRVVAARVEGGRVVSTIRTKGIDYAENVDVDVVQVTVTVTDAHGKFVPGLPQSKFHIFEDGRPQKITHFGSENLPLELIVAVDISGSMGPSMPKLKQAVKEFLRDIPAGNQVTLIGFNDTVFTLTRRTTSPAERIKAVDRLAPWGATALYDVLIRGVGMLGRQAGRKAIVIFTDGEDQGSHATIADVERRLQSSDVTLYMIGQGRGVTREALHGVMNRLSGPTGGRAFFTDNIDQLHGAFDELLDELSNQYLLGYPRGDDTRDDRWRTIKVAVDGHVEVRARQGYRVALAK